MELSQKFMAVKMLGDKNGQTQCNNWVVDFKCLKGRGKESAALRSGGRG